MRTLRQDERDVIAALLRDLPEEQLFLGQLDNAVVEDMNDGGMGSIKFVQTTTETEVPRFGRQIREATFTDADGLPVSIALFLDKANRLFELDVFKADFSPLKRLPRPEELWFS